MTNQDLFNQANAVIPGGVNSPVRAFKSVDSTPIFIQKASGPFVYDSEDNRYIDYVLSWGPMILGHANAHVAQAIRHQAGLGWTYGAPTALETKLAKLVQNHMPVLEKIRFVNSGTEATMTAVRLARGFTGRNLIIKFTGCYHGHSDALLVKAGSGSLTLGQPSSPGIPADTTSHTLSLDYNDSEQIQEVFAKRGHEIAAVIIEPIAGNMNFIPATPDFLTCIRSLCTKHHSVLIFDEVMSGFRVGLGGAVAHYGITPDLVTLGKVIGGGMPVGALGGRKDIMSHLAPEGPVYQAGTLSGNPMAMRAGIATLEQIEQPNFFASLAQKTASFVETMNQSAKQHQYPFKAQSIGSMFGMMFTDQDKVQTFDQVQQTDAHAYTQFFKYMLDHKIYFAPSSFEAGFMSSAHTQTELDHTIQAAQSFFKEHSSHKAKPSKETELL